MLTEQFWERLNAVCDAQREKDIAPSKPLPLVGSLWVGKKSNRRGIVTYSSADIVTLCFNEATGSAKSYPLEQFLRLYREV